MSEISGSASSNDQARSPSEALNQGEHLLAIIPETAAAPTRIQSPSSPEQQMLVKLPREILGLVCGHLSNSDIKKLRLTCRALASSELRFDRVYISPSKKALEVFYGIANTPNFAARVKEIVWDDSVMKPYDQDIIYYLGDSFRHTWWYDTKESYSRDYEIVYGQFQYHGIW